MGYILSWGVTVVTDVMYVKTQKTGNDVVTQRPILEAGAR